MQPITVTVGPLAAASATAICASQTPSAGALTINGSAATGGVATLDTARRVLITCAGNESGKTFTITGTNYNGKTQTETLAGPNATTVQSVLDYKTITSVSISANAAGAVTVGTNGVASSRWVYVDSWAFAEVNIMCDVSGTVNYTVQKTLENPNDPTNPIAAANVSWVNSKDSTLVSANSTIVGLDYTASFYKVTINSGTGSVTATIMQNGAVPF